MSRDKRGNRTQEVDGSIPFSSTTSISSLRPRKTVVAFVWRHTRRHNGKREFVNFRLPVERVFSAFQRTC